MRPKLHNRPVGTIISQPILRVLFVPRLVNRSDFCSNALCTSFVKSRRISVWKFWKLRAAIALVKLLQVPSSCRFAFGTEIGACFIRRCGEASRKSHLTKLCETVSLSLLTIL